MNYTCKDCAVLCMERSREYVCSSFRLSDVPQRVVRSGSHGNKNVTISYRTLNSTTANIINITGNCENIEIYHNYIKGSTTVTNSTKRAL